MFIALSWLFFLWDEANLTATYPRMELYEILLYFPLIILPILLISWLAKPFITDNSTFIIPKFFKHLVFLVAIGLIPLGFEESYRSKLDWEEFLIYLSISFILFFFLWQGNYFKRNKS
jgi:hypothetical protein